MRSLCAPYWVYDINTKNALHLHQHRLSSTVRNASAHKVRARCAQDANRVARKVRARCAIVGNRNVNVNMHWL